MGFLALVGVFEVTNGIIKGACRISKMTNIQYKDDQNHIEEMKLGG